jgi:hypothetical protein
MRVVAGFSQRRPELDPRSGYVGFAVKLVALGQVSPPNSQTTDCSMLIYLQGLVKWVN